MMFENLIKSKRGHRYWYISIKNIFENSVAHFSTCLFRVVRCYHMSTVRLTGVEFPSENTSAVKCRFLSRKYFLQSCFILLFFVFSLSFPLFTSSSPSYFPSFSSSLSLPHSLSPLFSSPSPLSPPSPPLHPSPFVCPASVLLLSLVLFVMDFFFRRGEGGGVTGYKGHCISFLCVSVICLPSGGGLRRFGFGRSR